jgi:hypothetical protein
MKEKLSLNIIFLSWLQEYRVWNYDFEDYFKTIEDVANGIKQSNYDVMLHAYGLEESGISQLKNLGINIESIFGG